MTTTRGIESDPTWSSKGDSILFSSTQSGGAQIYQIGIGGNPMRRIPTRISGQCTEPAGNPLHSDQIAFTALMGREFEIALYDAQTGRSTVLTQGPGDAVEPNWTQDGRHLIYTARRGASRRLHLLDTITGKTTPLPHDNLGSAWQADYYYHPEAVNKRNNRSTQPEYD